MRSHLEQKALNLVARIAGAHVARGLGIVALLVRRDLALKYRKSALGYLWSMVNPLLSMLVVTLVFGHFIKGIPQYHLHVLAGVLVWGAISTSIVGGTHSLVAGGNLLRKVRMQPWIFPISPVGMSLANFTFSLVPFLVIYFASGNQPRWQWGLLPVAMGLLGAFLLGLTLVLSISNVFFRDVGHVLEPVLQLAFYGTPIVYDRASSTFPPWVKQLLALNPFTHFVELFRSILIAGEDLRPVSLLVCAGLSASALVLGYLCYRRGRNNLMMEL